MAIHVNSIDEAVEDMKKRGEKAIRIAVNKAANVGVEDIYKFSISCIDQYYANYIPSIYDRTYQLYNTVSPVHEISEGGGMISAKVGVKFDPGALGSHEHRTFWGNRPGMENGYSNEILNDFLDGIHPMTSGSPEPGTPALMVQDGVSTDSLLNRYLPLYLRQMERLINNYFTLSI
jgi:hypothetical protein